MAPRIYTSPFPDVPIVNMSIFTRLFASRSPDDVGGFPGNWTAYVDAASGASLTRAELKKLALSFAYGLRNHPSTKPFAKRGDTALIFSPNSLAWPMVLFGSADHSPDLLRALTSSRRCRRLALHARKQRVYEP